MYKKKFRKYLDQIIRWGQPLHTIWAFLFKLFGLSAEEKYNDVYFLRRSRLQKKQKIGNDENDVILI